MENLKRDVAYAVRLLAAARKFTVIVIATLALGLGANTAVFSVLDAVVLRPLPYPEPERLVRIYQTVNGDDIYMPGPALLAYRNGSSALEIAPVYTYSSQGADLTGRPQPERVTVLSVGADYFSVLGRAAEGLMIDHIFCLVGRLSIRTPSARVFADRVQGPTSQGGHSV